MLKPKDKKEITRMIKEQMKVLDEKISAYRDLTKPIAPENAIGRVSRMDAINNKSVNEAALRVAEKKFVSLKTALEKVNEDYFGLCTSCGHQIPIGRILLMPGSTKCVNCAS